MRVVLVRRGYSGSGGAESYLLRLAGGLLARGREVLLLGDRPWPEEVLPEGMRAAVLGGRGPVRFADAVRDWLVRDAQQARGPRRVLSLERLWSADWYRAGDGVHAAWLERRKGFESRWRTLARVFNAKHADLLALERSLAGDNSVRIVCNARFVAKEWMTHGGVAPERLAVVPNGFDPEPRWLAADRPALRADLAAELGLDPALPWVLFTGSGFERKGLPLLLEAWRGLPRAQLLVAGRGRLAGKTPDGVRLLGARRDVPRLAAAADLFCLPTWYDPFSNATLEAAAYGCPVITTSGNGFVEEMQAGNHGAVVEPGDVSGLGSALREWLEPGRAVAAREACRDNAARLSVARNVERTLELLDPAMPDGSTAGPG